jgi:hypothetical protein
MDNNGGPWRVPVEGVRANGSHGGGTLNKVPGGRSLKKLPWRRYPGGSPGQDPLV